MKTKASTALDLLFDIVGGFLLAAGTQVFSAPNGIAPGGVTGIAVLVNYLSGLPISVLVALLNIPILTIAWFQLGKASTLRTIKSVAVCTVMLEVARAILPAYRGETILAALYGGVLTGMGLALVFMRGSTTGGTDTVARLIQKRFPYVPVGRLMLALNGCVLLAAAVVYRNVENALFAMITIFTTSKLVDSVLYGLDMGKVLMIVTQEEDRVAEGINSELGRGCTLLEGKGAYTRQSRPVLLCAVRKSQVYEVKKLVFSIDPDAFIMAMEAGEIVGKGFKAADQQ